MAMDKNLRAQLYNKKYRDKQTRIKRLCAELDASVATLEKLPRCPDCAAGQPCGHTPERHRLLRLVELGRGELEQLDH